MTNCFKLCLALICLGGFALHAQTFSRQAVLKEIKQNSLHKIILTPQSRQYMSSSYNDVRIYDSSGIEVPYIVVSRSSNLYPALAKTNLLKVPCRLEITRQTPAKKTLVDVDFSSRQEISYIRFYIREPRLFVRHARILAHRSRQIKNKTENYTETIAELDLKSDDSLGFQLPPVYEPWLTIEIDNQDNAPLRIDSIVCKQAPDYLVCDLKANAGYTLMCGNTQLAMPSYDLDYFVNKLNSDLPEARLGEFDTITLKSVKTLPETKHFMKSRLFLWLCLLTGAIVVIWFSRSLLKDMAEKNGTGL